MGIDRKRMLACFLLVCLLPAMAACGGKPGEADDARRLGGTVYVPRFTDCGLSLMEVSASCADGQYFYLAGRTEESDADAGGGYAVSTGDGISFLSGGRPALFRVDAETGAASELTGYVPSALPEGGGGYVSITALAPGADGSLWVLEQITVYPSEADGLDWSVALEDSGQQIWRRLDSTGMELGRVSADDLARQLGVDSIDGMTVDSADRLYAAAGGTVFVLDGGGDLLFSLEGTDPTGRLLPLGGSAGLVVPAGQGGQTLRVIDSEAGDWGAEYPLPLNFSALYPGSGACLFYYDSGDSLYGCGAAGEQGEKLLGWSAVDVDQGKVTALQALPDGRLAALLRRDDSWPQSYELALLTPTAETQAAEKTVLRFATLELDYQTRARIADFNRHSDQYRVEIVDYSEFNTGGDLSAGLTKLNTEIAAGSIPDILDTTGLPLRQYAAKGLLEDLWPYIERDPELGRERVMEQALRSAEIDGKLCQVFGSFSIRTAVGASKVVGRRMGWTLEELKKALGSMPEGCGIFGQEETRGTVLDDVLSQELSRYVDWEEGTCAFDSPDFLSLLEFCGSFPAGVADDAEYEDEMSRLSQGRQMLMTASLGDFSSLQMYKAIFGGEVSFIGYPTGEGCGSSLLPSAGLALSAACSDKEGAWSFIRTVLLPEQNAYLEGFPTNRSAFQELAEESMKAVYARDEKGELVLDAKGESVEEMKGAWFWEGGMVEIHATTQSEYDQIMALYEAVNSVAEQDESVFRIVRESAAAYFSGDRTAEEAARDIQSRVKLYINEQR